MADEKEKKDAPTPDSLAPDDGDRITMRCTNPDCPGVHDVTDLIDDYDTPPDVRRLLKGLLHQIVDIAEADPMMTRIGVALIGLGVLPQSPVCIAFGGTPMTHLERMPDGAYERVVRIPGRPDRRVRLQPAGPPPAKTRQDARTAYLALDPQLQFEVIARMVRAGLRPSEWGIDADTGPVC